MRISELNIGSQVKEIIQNKGYNELFPPQSDAIETGVLDGKNLVLASPTASGKTLIAELCAMKHITERHGKVIYLTPLRALAWEKYEEFKHYTKVEKFNGQKIKVGVSTGDFDNRTTWIGEHDVLITTNEKCDSLLRHKSPWMENVSLVIADEIHLIGNDRGPTLEVALARLRQLRSDLQILALSATIRNANEVAEWLDANWIKTDWRPVPLREGVAFNRRIVFNDGSIRVLKQLQKFDTINIALNSVSEGGQTIIFVESRRRAQSLARMIAKELQNILSKKEQLELHEISSDISIYGEKTKLTDELSNVVSGGAAFHHAGLGRDHRRIIEESFKNGKIKILTATPTLAAGVNLPARTVIIGSYRRFSPGYGMYPISVLEYKQMSGRAGRPQYDSFGESVLIASSNDEQDALMDNYVAAQPERLYSRLAQETAIRSHTLAIIASDYAHTEEGLINFFRQTFYGYHYPIENIRSIITSLLNYLKREDMINYKGTYIHATNFGRRVSELYIDPLSAVIIRDGLKKRKSKITDLTWLHLICHTPNMRPIFRIRRKDSEIIQIIAEEHQDEFIFKPKEVEDYIENEQFLGEVKTAKVLNEWIEETSENELLERFAVAPGDRYSVVQNAEWLLYSAHELAGIIGIKKDRIHLITLRDRVKYGVRKKLLPLVRLRGVGRVRAKILFNSGYTSINKLKKTPVLKLVEIPLIGPRLAQAIKEQVGGMVNNYEWKKLKSMVSEQRSIKEFIEEAPNE